MQIPLSCWHPHEMTRQVRWHFVGSSLAIRWHRLTAKRGAFAAGSK
jgi:hypothetical protein